MASLVKTNATAKFQVLDLASLKVQHPMGGEESNQPGRANKQRSNKESGPKVTGADASGHIGGDFQKTKNPAFLGTRSELFDLIASRRAEEAGELPKNPITITLPDGTVKEGVSHETTPYDVALMIAKGLADKALAAKVAYTGERFLVPGCEDITAGDGMEDEMEELDSGAASAGAGELWDLKRPLEGDCTLSILKFEDAEAKTIFWHSSAHVLGEALEHLYGSKLTIGPPLTNGFYYDSYMGDNSITDTDFKGIDAEVKAISKKKQKFERLVVTKDEALELFAYNAFKHQLISTKVPDGSRTTVYRCGDLIDLCRGPHLPDTGKIKAFKVLRNSGTNWLGQTENDQLQRIYGVAFPDPKELKKYLANLEEAKKRDHRVIGVQQKLFFFHNLSPGSAFWLPHGARIYNKLMDFIKQQYWERGYTEVLTPNMYNSKLWETSGHWQHYAENMFSFDVEGQTFALKPMNCPGHCLMFDQTLRSYRDLPMRYADFGVLHRNELSGALTGLTRVRRFQQDDGHIFVRKDQIKDEVVAALNFMKFVYDTFGMTYKLELSTRPKKALGDIALWNEAEAALAAAMDEFQGEGTWKVNPEDGAFYGPKIDIKVMDAMERVHQCATVQLDFQLPIRFNLRYKTADGGKAEGDKGAAAASDGGAELPSGFERPVIIHRAMLGSVERMSAILIEHYAGKWPFWISPRQVMIVPIKTTEEISAYANELQAKIHAAGFHVDVDMGSETLNKKVRNAQLDQYNYILVVGDKEAQNKTANIRLRNNEVKGEKAIDEIIAELREQAETYAPACDQVQPIG